MSNIVEELQNGLKDNKELYLQIKNEEILNLIENYKERPYDYKMYEKYFNRKCKPEYITFLLSNINNDIEKMLKKERLEILEMKIEMLVKMYKGDLKKLLKQFKVNNEDLMKNIRELKELKQKMDLKKEMKKESKKEEERYNYIKNNLDKIIIDELKKYIETNEKTELLKDYMRYLSKINKKLINMRVTSEEYNKYLIKKLTEEDYESIDEMVEDNVTKDYINNEQLSLMILKYKNIKNETLEGLILEFPDEIDEKTIKKYREIEEVNEKTIKSEIKLHLLIEIMEICEQPKNDKYVEYLKNIYIENNMEKEYERIIDNNKNIKEMLMEFEDEELTFTKRIIEKIKKKEEYRDEILKRSINEDINEEEYKEMIKEYEMIEKLIEEEENTYEIIDSYVTNKISEKLQEMVDYNLSTNKDELKRNLKVTNQDDERIREQLQKYEIDRKNKKKYIYVTVNNIFKNNNIVEYFNFYRKLEKKLEIVNKNSKKSLEKVIQITMGQILEHYLKGINHYKMLDENEKDGRIYYNLNEDKEIRVYVEDQIMNILEYVMKNLNEEGEYIYKHLMKHIFEYEYYNTILKTEETISKNLGTDIMMINYSNKMNLINSIFNKDYNRKDLKKLNEKIEKRIEDKLKENMYSTKKYSQYYKIVELNEKYNILTEKELNYLKTQWMNLDFLSLSSLIKGKNTEEKSISALNFIKLFVSEVEMSMKENKININNEKNDNERKEEIEIIKELKSLMNGEMDMLKNKKVKVENIYVNNIIDIEKKIEDVDLTLISIKKFQKMYNDNSGKKVKEEIIKDSVIRTITLLDKTFNHKYEEKEMLLNTMLEEKNRLIVISKRNTRNLDYKNIYERLNKEQKNLYDIVKYITILYYIDCLINENKNIEKQISIKKEEEVKKEKLINKKVYVIKSKKMTKIVKKEGEKYITKEKEKLDRFDFILTTTLKNKVGKLIKGVYKGKYVRIIDIKDMNYFTNKVKKNKEIETKYYKELIKKLDSKKIEIKNKGKNIIVDETELSELEKYRRKLNKKDLDDKYILNIKINPRLNKIISNNEEMFIKEYREERIKEIEYQKIIYKEKINERKSKKIQYVVKVNEGDKNQKNILVDKEDIIINTDGLVNKEIIEMIKDSYNSNKKINFKSLYDLSKFLFEYDNLNIDNKLEYFTNIYKEGIEIFNYNKINRMNKILIEEKLIEKIKKIKKNIKIYKVREKKGKLDEPNKKMMKKYESILPKKENELKKIKIMIENEKLRKYNSKNEIEDKYKNEIKLEKNITYFKENEKELLEDKNEIKKIKIKLQEEERKYKEKLEIEINKLINKFKEELYKIMKEEEEKINLLKYINDYVLDREEEEEEEEFDLDELELELDNLFEDSEIEEPKNKQLTWLEIDALPDDYDFEEDFSEEEI